MPEQQDTFAHRVRNAMTEKHLTNAELARRSGVDASLLSRFLTESEGSRREPRLEHCLAISRALELSPDALMAGTDAANLLETGVPWSEFEAEAHLRTKAQAEAAQLRTEIAGLRQETSALAAAIDRLTMGAATAASELEALRATRDADRAKLTAAIADRNRFQELAHRLWLANQKARVELARAKNSAAAAGAIGGVVGALTGALAALATAKPSPAGRSRRRGDRTPT